MGLTRKWPHSTHPPLWTQCKQYLSCYKANFDQTLNVGFWDQQQQQQNQQRKWKEEEEQQLQQKQQQQ